MVTMHFFRLYFFDKIMIKKVRLRQGQDRGKRPHGKLIPILKIFATIPRFIWTLVGAIPILLPRARAQALLFTVA
jgi:hypothetical protein